MNYYISLPGGKIKKTDDTTELLKWIHEDESVEPHGKPFMDGGRRVARTDLPEGGFVSTVFLYIDHRWSSEFVISSPLLFETMNFGLQDGEEEHQIRYSSHEEALKGHEELVKTILEARLRRQSSST